MSLADRPPDEDSRRKKPPTDIMVAFLEVFVEPAPAVVTDHCRAGDAPPVGFAIEIGPHGLRDV